MSGSAPSLIICTRVAARPHSATRTVQMLTKMRARSRESRANITHKRSNSQQRCTCASRHCVHVCEQLSASGCGFTCVQTSHAGEIRMRHSLACVFRVGSAEQNDGVDGIPQCRGVGTPSHWQWTRPSSKHSPLGSKRAGDARTQVQLEVAHAFCRTSRNASRTKNSQRAADGLCTTAPTTTATTMHHHTGQSVATTTSTTHHHRRHHHCDHHHCDHQCITARDRQWPPPRGPRTTATATTAIASTMHHHTRPPVTTTTSTSTITENNMLETIGYEAHRRCIKSCT
jgi:hypothetical protein